MVRIDAIKHGPGVARIASSDSQNKKVDGGELVV